MAADGGEAADSGGAGARHRAAGGGRAVGAEPGAPRPRGPGYTVVVAANGVEALRVAGERGDVEVVVTDVVMPEMGGVQLMDRLQAIRPDLPVILTSGYSTEELPAAQRHPAAAFLRKPFSPEELADGGARRPRPGPSRARRLTPQATQPMTCRRARPPARAAPGAAPRRRGSPGPGRTRARAGSAAAPASRCLRRPPAAPGSRRGRRWCARDRDRPGSLVRSRMKLRSIFSVATGSWRR